MRYVVVIEKGPTSYSAHVPDLRGCAAVGDTEAEVRGLIREAIRPPRSLARRGALKRKMGGDSLHRTKSFCSRPADGSLIWDAGAAGAGGVVRDCRRGCVSFADAAAPTRARSIPIDSLSIKSWSFLNG